MQSLFNEDYAGNPPIEHPPSWNVLKTKLENNLKKATKYYKNFPTYTGNKRLVDLVYRLLTWVEDPLPIYISKVRSERVSVASSAGITNPVNSYSDLTPYFLGGEFKEILYSDEYDFDPYAAYREWENLKPCKFLSHPNTDISLLLNDGVSAMDGDGLVVISVDIELFAIQLKGWYDYMKTLPDEQQYGVNRFINAYPITGSLESYMHVSMFNILHNEFKGYESKDGTTNPFFFLPELHGELVRHLIDTAGILKRKDLSYAEVLKSVSLIGDVKDLYELQRLGGIYRSSVNRWVLNYAKLPYFEFLFRHEAIRGYDVNQIERQKIVKEFERMRHGKMNGNVLSGVLLQQTLKYQNDVLKRFF